MDKKFLDYEGVSFYDDLIKEHVAEEVELTHLNDATIPDVQLLDEPYENNIDALADDIANKVATAFMSITAETVTVVVTTQVPGLSVANLTLNVIYNDNPTKIAQLPITDGNGMCSFRVPNGYTYKIIFPDKPNCHEIIPVQHTAAILQRSVEVEYVAKTQEEIEDEKGERVLVLLADFVAKTATKPSDITINLSVSNRTLTATTNSNGQAEFYIDPQYYGLSYTVTVPLREGLYIDTNIYSKTFIAEKTARTISFNYRSFVNGITIITEDGTEYTKPEWEAATDPEENENPIDKNTALLIKVATSTLAGYGTCYAVRMRDLRISSPEQLTKLTWCNYNLRFYNIPLNGASFANDPEYFYDGLRASEAIRDEGAEQSNISTNAVTKALSYTVVLAEGTENERTLQGFLPSPGLMLILWNNRDIIDDILEYTFPTEEAPEGTTYRRWSSFTTNKWTTGLFNETRACVFTNVIVNTTGGSPNNNKTHSNYVLPFFVI